MIETPFALHILKHATCISLLAQDVPSIAFVVMQVTSRTDPHLATRAGSMYFYCVGMFTRAEDPRNRVLADMFYFTYPPSGRQGQASMP